MRHFPGFPSRDWTTIGDMRNALRSASITFIETSTSLPKFGLALLQLKVDQRPLHGLYSLSQTHWVGVCDGSFYDVNWGGWLPISIWEEVILPQFSFRGKAAITWETRNGLSITDETLMAQTFVRGQKAPSLPAFSVSWLDQEASSDSECPHYFFGHHETLTPPISDYTNQR
jgi:hypothetical protein